MANPFATTPFWAAELFSVNNINIIYYYCHYYLGSAET